MLGLKRNASRASQTGVTILEVMLVMAIGASILFFSIQQYLTYRKDADAVVVESNVDAIFQAMSAYYRINCYGPSNTDGSLGGTGNNGGTLNPKQFSGINKLLNMNTDLITPALLNGNGIIINPLIDAAGATSTAFKGYVAQFNKTQPSLQRQVCENGTGTTPTPGRPTPIPTCSTALVNTGEIVIWKAQVAAKLNDTTNASTYLNFLGADCLSSPGAGGIINPCSSNTPGAYVVWERLPSAVNPGAASPYWESMPTVTQFTLMYRTAPILNLTNQFQADSQTYLCGN